MNYQPFPREAHFTAVDGNWTATIWFPAAVRHTSNKCSSRVPNINMCNPCANGHKSTPPPSLDSRQREDANSKWNPRMPPALPELLTALVGQNLQICVRPTRRD